MVTDSRDADDGLTRFRLEIWHPDCWTLEVTERTEGGLLGHGVYEVDDGVVGRFTAFGNSVAIVDDLVTATRNSPLTASVREFGYRGGASPFQPPGNAVRGLLVGYETDRSINGPLTSRGFIPDAPVRIQDGREIWTVVTALPREDVRTAIREVRREMAADVTLLDVSTPAVEPPPPLGGDRLSERQREVFELARERGYYGWPRRVSADELAGELGVSKSTTLEHLRKAEAKLLARPSSMRHP